MALIVQKYGGTSVAEVERIRNVARKVGAMRDKGNDMVIVLSAMSGETDRLLRLAHQIAPNPSEREMDVMMATGEQVSVALLAIALQSMGYRACSYLGHQVKILTDRSFTKARIKEIDREKILQDLKKGYVVIVAGFQGVDKENNITTLGRGGSDTSAVAIAAALEADVCEVYTDVDGIYTTDPNICSNARKREKISYDEMLEMASLGAKVLQIRSVGLAKKFNVPLCVKSTFIEGTGTVVTREDMIMEKVLVAGITYDTKEAKITIKSVPDVPGVAARIFEPLSNANIVVDMIIQNASVDGKADVTFTIPKADYRKAMEIVRRVGREMDALDVQGDENIAKVSIVGTGMRDHPGVAAQMFSTLGNEGINIMMISTSEIKISCVIEDKYTELAVRVLHDVFGLAEPSAQGST
ncbi:MAG: aspartate kinase [Deltaproteobacteria bacterium]|nr:aspartate kinase [Deltaproteobacteria bacterium]